MISLSHRAPSNLTLAHLSRFLRNAVANFHLPATRPAPASRNPGFAAPEFSSLAPDQTRELRYGLGRQDTGGTDRAP